MREKLKMKAYVVSKTERMKVNSVNEKNIKMFSYKTVSQKKEVKIQSSLSVKLPPCMFKQMATNRH